MFLDQSATCLKLCMSADINIDSYMISKGDQESLKAFCLLQSEWFDISGLDVGDFDIHSTPCSGRIRIAEFALEIRRRDGHQLAQDHSFRVHVRKQTLSKNDQQRIGM